MKLQRIKQFLSALGRHKTEVHGAWVQCSCLFAQWKHHGGKDSNPSFGIKVVNGKSFYNCFSCNSAGSLEELLVQLVYYSKHEPDPSLDIGEAYRLLDEESQEVGYTDAGDFHEFQSSIGHSNYIPWPEWWLSSFQPAGYVSVAENYLKGRGFPLEFMGHFDVRYDSKRHAVCFPVRTQNGDLVGLRGRYIVPVVLPDKELRYHDYEWQDYNNTSWVYHHEHPDMFQKPLVLVEGVFDVASVYRVYSNVITPMSSQFNKEKAKRLEYAPAVVCFFDNDKGGELATSKVEKYLGATTLVKRVQYPEHIKHKDAGEMTVEEVKEVLKSVDLP